jgi:hypothetical protein
MSKEKKSHLVGLGDLFDTEIEPKKPAEKPKEEPKVEPKSEQKRNVWVPQMINGEWEIY